MATNQSRRISPTKKEADQTSFEALQTIESYTPINSKYSITAVTSAHEELHRLRGVEVLAAADAAAAREISVAKEWEFHNLMLGVKEQVIAQFGKDSDEVQALGLKRKSQYKSPKRRSRATG